MNGVFKVTGPTQKITLSTSSQNVAMNQPSPVVRVVNRATAATDIARLHFTAVTTEKAQTPGSSVGDIGIAAGQTEYLGVPAGGATLSAIADANAPVIEITPGELL